MPVADCRIVELPTVSDGRGSLTFAEACRHVPFEIKRIYYFYDVPKDAKRGWHGHKKLEQLIIAVNGSFDIVLDDGQLRQRFTLSRPHNGLYVCPMIWREIDNFGPGAVCMVLASDYYDEADYYRDYGAFLSDAKDPR